MTEDNTPPPSPEPEPPAPQPQQEPPQLPTPDPSLMDTLTKGADPDRPVHIEPRNR
jgi:hypothetical protein